MNSLPCKKKVLANILNCNIEAKLRVIQEKIAALQNVANMLAELVAFCDGKVALESIALFLKHYIAIVKRNYA